MYVYVCNNFTQVPHTSPLTYQLLKSRVCNSFRFYIVSFQIAHNALNVTAM